VARELSRMPTFMASPHFFSSKKKKKSFFNKIINSIITITSLYFYFIDKLT